MQRAEGNPCGDTEGYLKKIILEAAGEMPDFYIEPSAREILPITRRIFEENTFLAHEFKISQLVEKEKRLIIYGEAGSGKTSTLRWLNTTCAGEYLEKKEEYIPIYVTLDSYVKGSFYAYLKAKAKQKGILEPDLRELLEGKALLLLDGLDMLRSSENFSPLDEISDFISDHEDCRYAIASRHSPSGSIKSTFAVCKLEKFSDEKIELFIESSVPKRRQAKILKSRSLNKTNSHPFLRNPLLLKLWIKTSIAGMRMVGKERLNQELTYFDPEFIPSNRAELYQAFISELFRNSGTKEDFFSSEKILSLKESKDMENCGPGSGDLRNSEKLPAKSTQRTGSEKIDFERIEIENFLMDLAFKLQCEHRLSCKYGYALKTAEKYTKQNPSGKKESKKTEARKLLKACFELGLLTRNRSEVRFGINRDLQEYYAALKLKQYFEQGMEISETFGNPGWENVVIFISEMVESGEELVSSVILNKNLELASKCAAKTSLETKEKLCSLLAGKLDSRYTMEKMRVIQSLGRLGDCGIEAISGVFEYGDTGVKREAIRILGETRSEMALVPLTAAFWDEDYSVRVETVKALSMIGSEKAVELLTNALADENRAVRLEATDALMRIESEKALEILVSALGDKDDFVRFGAMGALGRANPQKAAASLIKAFKEENKLVQLGAAEALGQMRSEKAVEPFMDALQDEDEFVRWIAIKALGKIKSDKTPDTFTCTLGDKSHFVRREAAKALGMLGSGKTLDLLVSALSDENEFVRKAATEALGERGPEIAGSNTAVGALVKRLGDESHLVRLEAAKALGMARSREAVTPLLLVLGDENRFVRKEAAKALGQLEPEKVLELLIHALESGNHFMRQGAVRALRQMSSDETRNQISDKVFDILDNAFQDEDKLVRREAARALENISRNRPERAFQSLINALDDEDEEVRRLLAGVLGCLGSETAVPKLIRALKSEDETVRRFAAEALGQIRSKKVLKPLIDTMFFDASGVVKGEAARALGKVKSRKAVEPLIDALLDENNEGRWGAAEALGRIKAETAVGPLILALADRDDFTRFAAAKALGRIKPKKAIEPLINALYDRNRFVKAEATGALMKICTKEDKDRMQVLLASENELAANLAFEILEEIEMQEVSKTRLFPDLQ
ncbi:phycocyanin subunit alpha [Methanosarcina sp. 2.H.T.1A.6]|uniref:HEAT repeat domain-containing protein n=1 Tax=unclassified Methanosarcina TaxID=2644672 RepID=UPI000621F90E|nr:MULTISPECIES: HEAT repeat domain-containing protein [unclassified Methanosarcina]KKG09872.1 phycocyanin subunit alpha [Methanosarcina sp. 2.H.T.1A.15]KKG17694.1 phycocyanin subunit alpha [Methanosarcina sp. 2.H.T.1A.3]KKG21934.1 phycocyanin subunit alpha [Methanosarcina sp. 2.H.T.1A.6]KKG25470.1 phycocyanin subunit alpha [Methanosarcina sp. 2.H.T.1A.8]